MVGNASTTPEAHPKVIEMARRMKERGLSWEVQTGDWFETDGELDVALDIRTEGEVQILTGRNGGKFNKDEVTHLIHHTDCLEWLKAKHWRYSMVENLGDITRIRVERCDLSYKFEKTDATELAATYAAIIEILDLEHFGWVH